MGGANAPSCADTGTGITTVYDYAYTYEATGDRLTAITSKVDTTPQTATYAYTFDNENGRSPHRLTQITNPAANPTALLPRPTTQAWNDAGRVTAATPPGGTPTEYAYDRQGRLATTKRGDLVVSNVYDTDGLRISRTTTKDGVSPKRVIYLAGGLELTATGATGTASLTNARRDHATPEGIPLGSQDNAAMTWVLADVQSTTRLTATTNAGTGTNGNGGTVTAHDYTPYGDPVNTTVTPPALAPTTTPGDRGYLNKPHDPNGDIRLDHRTYNPSTATFTSPDPILITTDPLNLNPYTYGRHNPLTLTDPSGLLVAASDGGGNIASGPMIDNRCSVANPCSTDRSSFWEGTQTLVRDLSGGAVNGAAQLTSLGSTAVVLQLIGASNPAISASNSLNKALGVDTSSGVYTLGQLFSPIPGAGVLSAVVKSAIAGTRAGAEIIRAARAARSAPAAANAGTDLVRAANFADRGAAFRHYSKHVKGIELRPNGGYRLKPGGADMPEFSSFAEYQSAARGFMTPDAPAGVMQGYRGADLIRLDPKTGYFGVRAQDGTIRTFFRPDGDPIAYFRSQFQ